MGLIYFLISVLFVLSGIKSFEPWPQVSKLWENEINPLLILGHAHMPRYLVVYLGFRLEELFPNAGFSLYISIFLAMNFLLLRRVSLLSIKRTPSFVVYLIFFTIHLAMNGRGVIAWTAWLLCLLICYKISLGISSVTNQIGWLALSCLLAAVTTGVFILIILAFAFVILGNLKVTGRWSLTQFLFTLMIAIPIGYLSLDYFILAITKNAEFYGGGIESGFRMLEHGLGIIFLELNLLNAIIFWGLACGFVIVIYFHILTRRFSLLSRFVVLSTAGGLFGFTVLTLVIPLLLLGGQAVLATHSRGWGK